MLRGDRPTLFTTHNSMALLEKFNSRVTQIGTLSMKPVYLMNSKGCIHQGLGDGHCSLLKAKHLRLINYLLTLHKANSLSQLGTKIC